MKNKNTCKWQRIFPLIIAMAMVFSMLPVSALASDDALIIIGGDGAATPAATDGDDNDNSDNIAATPSATDSGLILIGGEDDPDALAECDCEVKCTEEDINTDCPVCVNNPEWCVVGVVGAEIAPMSGTPTRTKQINLTSSGVEKEADSSDWGNPTSASIDALADEGWKWEYPAKILTLDGLDFNYSGSGNPAIRLPADSTIVLTGANSTIENTTNDYGITTGNGKLTIEGTSELTVTSVFQGTNCKDFEMKGGTLRSITSSGNGVVCSGNFTMTGGTIYAEGTTNAMSVAGTVPLLGVLDIKGHDGDDYSNNARFGDGSPKALETTMGGNAVLKAKITVPGGGGDSIDYTLYFNSTNGKLYKDNDGGDDMTDTFTGAGKKASVTGAGSSWTLVLKEGFDFTTSAETALEVSANTTIQVTGEAMIASTSTSGNRNGIWSSGGNLTIDVAAGKKLTVNNTGNGGTIAAGINSNGRFTKSGDGTLETTAGTASSQSCGIMVSGGNFIMNAGTVTATGANLAGIGVLNGNFIMTAGTIFANVETNSPLGSMAVLGGTYSIANGIVIKGRSGNAYTVNASFKDFAQQPGRNAGAYTIQDNSNNVILKARLSKGSPAPAPAPAPAPSPSIGGGGGSSSPAPPSPTPVVAPLNDKTESTMDTAINSAVNASANASANDTGTIKAVLKNVSVLTKENVAALIKKAKELGTKATVSSDVMSEDGKYVEVRVTLDPALIKENVRLDGYVRKSQTMQTESKFKRFCENKIAVISLGQEKSYGQTARISARLDLKGFNTANLYLYSYDRKTNKYTLITSKNYKIDKKGYLIFDTGLGGDIIVSDGKLTKK